MYRDGSNYKEFETIVVKGKVTKEELEELCDNGEYGPGDPVFIPSQVGLENLQPRMEKFPNEDDHVWHEISDVEPTDKFATHGAAQALLLKFQKATGKWDIVGTSEKLGII